MAKPGKLQTSLEYLLARTVLSGLGILPRSLAIAVGLSIGRLAYFLAGNLRRTGQRNLEIAFPEMPKAERTQLLRGCFAIRGKRIERFLPVRLNTISFACNLCIPMNANGIRSRSSARFLLLRQAVQSLRFISQMLGSFSLLGCCAFSRLLSLRFQCPSVSPLFHFGGMGQ